MLDVARRDGSQVDIRNCERGVELYRETYSQVAAEANHPTPSSCVLPPTACWVSGPSRAMTKARKSRANLEPEPEERDVSKAGQNEFADFYSAQCDKTGPTMRPLGSQRVERRIARRPGTRLATALVADRIAAVVRDRRGLSEWVPMLPPCGAVRLMNRFVQAFGAPIVQ
jgi:hypothetical protein